MGVDIFMYAERRNGDRWDLATPLVENEWWAKYPNSQVRFQPVDLYPHRNSALWAILADIGNDGSGPNYEPVAPPRGLPVDHSTAVQEWLDRWAYSPDAFGWSWLTLRELETFDWNKTILKQATVDEDLAYLFQADRPFPLDRWPEGREIALYSGEHRNGTIVRWTETYAYSAGREFMEQVMPQLREYGPPDDVRIVFWFKV